MPSILDSRLHTGAVVGAGTVLLGLGLSWLFLVAVGDRPVGSTRPFVSLTAGGPVPSPTAAAWTFLDAQGVQPTVAFETDGGAEILVVRGVLDVLAGPGEAYTAVRAVPPLLLAGAGALATGVAWRVRPRSNPLDGAAIVCGYAPALFLAGLLAQVPVAPGMSGSVEVGNSVFDAAAVAGVSAGPNPVLTAMLGLAYPVVFGLLGGAAAAAAVRLGGRVIGAAG